MVLRVGTPLIAVTSGTVTHEEASPHEQRMARNKHAVSAHLKKRNVQTVANETAQQREKKMV